MSLDQHLSALELSILPTWVYDHARMRFPWVNTRAVALWRASDRAELLSRDMSGLSLAVRTRLDNYQRAVLDGETVLEDWTLYPRGVPEAVTLHGQAVQLDDGRTGILFQALPRQAAPDDAATRGVEAVRHTSALISLVDGEGHVLFHNPAVMRAMGTAATLDVLFPDRDVAASILQVLAADAPPFTAEVAVGTPQGERLHLVEARATTDPVTGARAILVQQLDLTAQRRAEVEVEAQRQLIEELNRSLVVVAEQRQQILALSAPILEVGRGTLAVPLIGQLDAARGDELGARLLPAITSRGARHVILDLTGADALDRQGATALERLSRALSLLGARAILTGVQPEVARALVEAGIHAEGFTILRTLGEGLEACRAKGPAPL
ncbi:STAS domain-containing protein [Chondromyces apiculatus]|uniref:RsbR, positive regulator of sigma-B n=1 Tax=Chondromyces apiculatus DSM 436 TaxID=1192034 RepID=A0A017TEX2_9BACT|nr:STAS domain-containing protein [Chondromyces apiculatus]EYF07794.1 RsbR, positive regulator of sigma-B [Chondromyces apiculatus DSM 436]